MRVQSSPLLLVSISPLSKAIMSLTIGELPEVSEPRPSVTAVQAPTISADGCVSPPQALSTAHSISAASASAAVLDFFISS